MAYEVVDNFAAGLDLRKSPLTAPGGTLVRLKNAVINPGGEIEKRRAFVKLGSNLLAGTFGLASTEATLYAFTRNVTTTPPALGVPGTTLKYQRLPNAAADLQQMDYDTFDGKVYFVGYQASGADAKAKNPHYYDGFETEGSGKGYYIRTYQSKVYSVSGKYLYFSAVNNPVLWNESALIDAVIVTKLDKTNPATVTVALADISKFTTGMKVLIQGATGTGLTVANGIKTVGTVNAGIGTFTLNATDCSTATAAQTTGLSATPAINVVSISSANPAVVTVAAADIGKFTNEMTVEIFNATGTGTVNANGKHQISGVGSPANSFTLVNVNTSGGVALGSGIATVVHSADTARTGAGFINLSLQDSDSEFLTSLEVYYDKLAIFSSEAVQLWAVDPDPLQNAYVQLLRGTGTTAPRSTSQYGSGDVLYLDQSGVRSLRARDSSNSAAVSDIGSPIDAVINGENPAITPIPAAELDKGIALLEPLVGRFWMVFPNKLYSLSYFPGPEITAWSEHTPGFTIDHAVACGGRIYARSGDELYVYGGVNGNQRDACGVEVRLPYLNGKKPGHNKIFEALDMSIAGTWEVYVNYNPSDPEAEELVGTFSAPTWNGGRAELSGYASHISLRFKNTDANHASISNIAIHYQLVDDEQ
jgi:hypothetical protein